jgi:hypothetical protein
MRSTNSSFRRFPAAARAPMALTLVAALVSACMMFARAPENLDYSRTRQSASGVYRATVRPQGDTIPQGRLHTWTLHLESASGQPVDSARVAVDGGMPQHGHGLPTKPRARELGNGDYAVEGMKFNMGGWWVVKFRVQSEAGSDSVEFNVKL